MLSIQSLSTGYGSEVILDEVTLSVNPGEVLAVIGPNGAGKSTLIRAVSGVLRLRHGMVSAFDEDITRLVPMQRARYLAVVPQAKQLPSAFTVYQTVLLGRTPHLSWLGRPGESDHQRVRLAMERTQTVELADRRVSELSGGEQQRVLLARALAQDAPILLLDEPTTHLDLQHQSSLLNLIRELSTQKNLAILMVVHDLNLASLYADRVALLVSGRLQALGSPAEVLTAEILSQVYHVSVNVVPHPDYNTPLVLPDGRLGEPVARG